MEKAPIIMIAGVVIIALGFLHVAGTIEDSNIEAQRECSKNHLKGDTSLGVVKDFEVEFETSRGYSCSITFETGIKKQYFGQICTVLETKKILVDDGYNCGVGYNTYKMIALESQEKM